MQRLRRTLTGSGIVSAGQPAEQTEAAQAYTGLLFGAVRHCTQVERPSDHGQRGSGLIARARTPSGDARFRIV